MVGKIYFPREFQLVWRHSSLYCILEFQRLVVPNNLCHPEMLFGCLLPLLKSISNFKLPETNLHPPEVLRLPLMVPRTWALPPRVGHHDRRHRPGEDDTYIYLVLSNCESLAKFVRIIRCDS